MAKRMSMDEKKRLALEFLHESKSVFTPKELPDLWYREKKISKSSGEAVIKEMEGDGLIRVEKIGISNYVWSFASEQSIRAQQREKAVLAQHEELDKELALWEARKEKAESERCDPTRERSLDAYYTLTNKIGTLEEEVGGKLKFDPSLLEQYDKDIAMAREAADRWTNNIFSIIQYLKQAKGWSNAEALKKLGFPQDFDFLE